MNWMILLYVAEIIFIYMCSVFLLAQVLKNNSIVDIFWGLGFVVIVSYLLMTQKPFIAGAFVFLSKHLVDICIVLWGLRLAIYIFIRNYGKGEDWRYNNFRKQWGKHPYLGAFFQVFMLQGLLMIVIALPVIFVNAAFLSVSYFTCIGMLIWVIGFLFEAIGDYQLYQFKKDPAHKGKPMQYGLWKYTRHPNYFGEILIWWGIWIMTIHFFTPLQTLIGIISPLTITFLLTKVSGVPMTESKYKDNPEYSEYIQKTPSLFPKFW